MALIDCISAGDPEEEFRRAARHLQMDVIGLNATIDDDGAVGRLSVQIVFPMQSGASILAIGFEFVEIKGTTHLFTVAVNSFFQLMFFFKKKN